MKRDGIIVNETGQRTGMWETFDISPETKLQLKPGSLVTRCYNIDGFDALQDILYCLGVDDVKDLGIRRWVHATCPSCRAYVGKKEVPFKVIRNYTIEAADALGPEAVMGHRVNFNCPVHSCYRDFLVIVTYPIITFR